MKKSSGLLKMNGRDSFYDVLCLMKLIRSKLFLLSLFILVLGVVGFGLIVLSPNVISIIISTGYALYFIVSKTTDYIHKELFAVRYEKSIFLLVLLVVAIIQFTINDAVRSLPLMLMGILFLVLAYLIFSWVYEKIKTIRELKNERLHSELSLLRAQVNPHFFFNTLNNLYGLAIEQSKETPKMLLKLSEMMRYTIYDGKKPKVFLKDELQFLENYNDLHSIRYHNKLTLSFETNIEDPHLEIPPLLLINLLENAFKHGAEKLDSKAWIKLRITTTKKLLDFVVENNYDQSRNEQQGIGLVNLRRRLELLFPAKHQLSLSRYEGVYRAELSLNLA